MAATDSVPEAPAEGGKGDRTRRRLLDMAVRRFAADGFRRTSVSDIARDAGLTPAAVYAYFAGKEALFFEAVDADAASLIERSRTAAAGPSVRDRWLGFLGHLRINLGDHPLARRVMSGQEPEVIKRLLDLPSLAAVRAALIAELREGQGTGEIRSDVDAEVLAIGIETISLSVIMVQLQVGGVEDVSRVLGAVAVFDAALRSPGTDLGPIPPPPQG